MCFVLTHSNVKWLVGLPELYCVEVNEGALRSIRAAAAGWSLCWYLLYILLHPALTPAQPLPSIFSFLLISFSLAFYSPLSSYCLSAVSSLAPLLHY